MSLPLLVIIGGPTGIGKTATGISIAKELTTEIISADSRQVYKELSIGTAVPTHDELREVKHHFIHTRSVDDRYNASMYEYEVLACLNQLFETKDIVVMVGGSGLYINAVIYGIDDLPTIPQDVRKRYWDIYNSEGLGELQRMVATIDPEYYSKVDQNNYKRLLKALEVYEITKKPYSSFLLNEPKARPFKTLMINLDIDREELYSRINNRVDKMVSDGLVEEASRMIKKKHLTPLKTVGYKELFEYFDGNLSLEEAITHVKNHTRAYARKQLTWFRRYKDAQWFNPGQITEMLRLIKLTA